MTLMTTLLTLCCVVTLCRSASLLYQPETMEILQNQVKDDSRSEVKDSVSSKGRPVYFAFDGLSKPYNFINKFGILDGFELDLVKAVCKEAGQSCETIMAESQQCVYTERDNSTGVPEQDMDYTGKGLLGRTFDACPGYEQTKDRHSIVDFTLPYLTTSCSYAVAPGNPSGFDPYNKNFARFKIVHVNGHSPNRQCLKRHRKRYDPLNLVLADSIPEAKEMVLNGQADVLFSSDADLRPLEVKSGVNCGGYAGVMVRQGSEVMTWWNKAFRQLYKSGRFTKLCEDGETKYGEKLRCLPHPDEASQEILDMMTEEEEVDHRSQPLTVFMASGRSAAYSYLDEDGVLQGFTKDLIDEVCSRAKKRCRFSLVSNKECIHRVGETYFPGRGIQSGWYQVCTGYYNTPERANSYDFTSSYLDNYAVYQVAPGNPTQFDPENKDMRGLVIVHKENGETNAHCMARLGYTGPTVRTCELKQECVDLVLKGQADVYFTTRLSMSDQLSQVGDRVRCDKDGTCMMLPKGSDVTSWWNPAMEEFYSSGDYSTWCQRASEKFQFQFPCLPHPSSLHKGDN